MDAKRPKTLVSRAKIGLCVPTNGDDLQSHRHASSRPLGRCMTLGNDTRRTSSNILEAGTEFYVSLTTCSWYFSRSFSSRQKPISDIPLNLCPVSSPPEAGKRPETGSDSLWDVPALSPKLPCRVGSLHACKRAPL